MSFAAADYLICEMRERGELLTPLKLQKLIFYADAWSMALRGQELTNERFQAWVHGPVAVSQYHRFKEYQWRPIDAEISKPDLLADIRNHLDEVIDVFGSETAVALERMTHNERPWIEARNGYSDDEACTEYIDKKITKKFYASLVED